MPDPTLAELLAAAPLECPPPPRPRTADAYDVTLEVPPSGLPGDRFVLEVRGGVWDRPGGGRCGHITGHTIRGDQAGPTATLSTDGSADCKPVPEPSLAGALLFGVVWLGVAAVSAPVMGRYLRRNRRRQYPRAEREDAPEP